MTVGKDIRSRTDGLWVIVEFQYGLDTVELSLVQDHSL